MGRWKWEDGFTQRRKDKRKARKESVKEISRKLEDDSLLSLLKTVK